VPRAEIRTENLTLSHGPCCVSRCHGHSNSETRDLRASPALPFTNLGRGIYEKCISYAITLPGQALGRHSLMWKADTF